MCKTCLHREVCKYRDGFERFNVKVPSVLDRVVQVEVSCQKLKDERHYELIRSMGTEV